MNTCTGQTWRGTNERSNATPQQASTNLLVSVAYLVGDLPVGLTLPHGSAVQLTLRSLRCASRLHLHHRVQKGGTNEEGFVAVSLLLVCLRGAMSEEGEAYTPTDIVKQLHGNGYAPCIHHLQAPGHPFGLTTQETHAHSRPVVQCLLTPTASRHWLRSEDGGR